MWYYLAEVSTYEDEELCALNGSIVAETCSDQADNPAVLVSIETLCSDKTLPICYAERFYSISNLLI